MPTNNTYLTQEGDMLEYICYKHYGRWETDILSRVWLANSWAVRNHLLLPGNKIIVLPYIPAEDRVVIQTLSMWKDSETATLSLTPSRLTFEPAEEYEGMTLEEYLTQYRLYKNAYSQTDEVIFLEQATQPLYGTLENNDNEGFRYIPLEGFSGIDRFQLRARDASGNTDIDTVEIMVRPNGGAWTRYTIYEPAQMVVHTQRLLFTAVDRIDLKRVKVNINSAEDLTSGSHQPLGQGNSAFVDFLITKRLASGGTAPFANPVRLFNNRRSDFAVPIGSSVLEPGESLVASITGIYGLVKGAYVDVQSTLLG